MQDTSARIGAWKLHPGTPWTRSSGTTARGGKTATRYHTARFLLVPALREDLTVSVPADRDPGRQWTPQPALFEAQPATAERAAPIRIGYARCSTVYQNLDSQLDALTRAQCRRVFSEKISTRIKVRPELEKALALAREITQAAPEQPVILTVHELGRLARNAAELMTLAATLQSDGIQLELLTGPLTGIYDPGGMGSMLFAVLAVAAQLDRNDIREKTLEGQAAAAAKGNHGGRPKVIDDDMLTFAIALKHKGTPVPHIAAKLVIKTGKNAGKHPSVASLYRALADAEAANIAGQTDEATADRHHPDADLSAPQPDYAAEPDRRDPNPHRQNGSLAPGIATLACPSCGHEPATRADALSQRADLTVDWLEPAPHDPGLLEIRHHCRRCQPDGPTADIACTVCGDGSILAGPLAASDRTGLPATAAGWLTSHGWQATPGPLCPTHAK